MTQPPQDKNTQQFALPEKERLMKKQQCKGSTGQSATQKMQKRLLATYALILARELAQRPPSPAATGEAKTLITVKLDPESLRLLTQIRDYLTARDGLMFTASGALVRGSLPVQPDPSSATSSHGAAATLSEADALVESIAISLEKLANPVIATECCAVDGLLEAEIRARNLAFSSERFPRPDPEPDSSKSAAHLLQPQERHP